MIEQLQTAFEKTAKLIFSLPPIMIGMLGMYVYLVYESQALLYELMPTIMGDTSKTIASLALSVAIHLTILTTSANSRLVSGWFPVLFALYAYGITATFFDAYDFSKTPKQIYEAHLFSSLIALINYLFTYLFVRKYQSIIGDRPLTKMVEELKQQLATLRGKTTKLENEMTTVVGEKDDLSTKHQQLTTDLRHLSQKYEETLQAAKEKRVCFDCGIIKKNLHSLNRYKADCDRCQFKKESLTKLPQTNGKPTTKRTTAKKATTKAN